MSLLPASVTMLRIETIRSEESMIFSRLTFNDQGIARTLQAIGSGNGGLLNSKAVGEDMI